MTHAINSDTNLLSTDITRTHTQMRKRVGKNGERQRVKKRKRKKGRKYKKILKKERKKEEKINK